jgi:hypothetical protein
MMAEPSRPDDGTSGIPLNVDEFRRIPVREVAALFPSTEAAVSAWNEMQSAATSVTKPRILQGEEGARILDTHGTEHGLKARLQRLWQNIGNLENDLAVYGEGLRKGEALLSVGCSRDVARELAQVIEQHGGSAIIYFDRYSAARLSGPYSAESLD